MVIEPITIYLICKKNRAIYALITCKKYLYRIRLYNVKRFHFGLNIYKNIFSSLFLWDLPLFALECAAWLYCSVTSQHDWAYSPRSSELLSKLSWKSILPGLSVWFNIVFNASNLLSIACQFFLQIYNKKHFY